MKEKQKNFNLPRSQIEFNLKMRWMDSLNTEMEVANREKDVNSKHEMEWKMRKNLFIKSILKITFWKVCI